MDYTAVRDIYRALFAHNDWARGKLLSLADGLPNETLDRPVQMGPGALRRTLRHLWGAERVWLERWRGASGTPGPKGKLSVAELGERSRETGRQRDEFLNALGPGGFERHITYADSERRTRRHSLGETMLQLLSHGTHRRAQALNMLRRIGAHTPTLDYQVWLTG